MEEERKTLCWSYKIETDKIMRMNKNVKMYEEKCIIISLQLRKNYIYNSCKKKK